MPIQIQAERPYYQRIYIPRPQRPGAAGAARGAARGRGAVGTGGIDTSSTGNVGGDFVKALGNQITLNRQNALANKLMNIQTPPRAGAVGPVVNPATGQVRGNITPTTGTAPITGGTGELQLRQQMDQQNLADQLQRAKIASQLALAGKRGGADVGGGQGGSGSAARWKAYLGGGGGQGGGGGGGGKAAKEPAYQPYQYDAETDSRADAFPHIQADFDAKYGKGMYGKVVPNLAGVTPDEKGNIVINDNKGSPLITLPSAEASYWQNRYNAGNVSVGHPTIGNLPPGTNPNSGQPSGSQVNPVAPKNNLELRSLPFGTWITDPKSGQTIQKQPLAPPAPKTSSAEDLSAQPVSVASAQPQTQVPPLLQPLSQPTQSSTGGDQGQDYTGGQPQPSVDQSQLMASNTPPGIFNIGQPTGGDLPPDQQLGDEIKRTQIANSLQGVA